jgi:hypothetical protein
MRDFKFLVGMCLFIVGMVASMGFLARGCSTPIRVQPDAAPAQVKCGPPHVQLLGSS